MRQKSIKSWIDSEINKLHKKSNKSRKKFLIVIIFHIIINICTIGTAIAAIYLLIESTHSTSLGVILAAMSVGLVVTLFFVNSFISIYQSIMRAKFYNEAIHKIELEIMKFSHRQDEYKDKNAENKLQLKIKKIAKETLKKKRNKNAKSVIIKALLGGVDV